MKRIQLALNVASLDEAIDFYTRFFATAPAKVRPGYANFAIDSPPLKLVLIEGQSEPGTINHLGVEVFSTDEVREATSYFHQVGLTTDIENETTCCFATQNKVWVDGPDASRWEVYTVLADAEHFGPSSGESLCCAPTDASQATISEKPIAPACC